MDYKQKILVCGDVFGNFKQLFNRVETINKKSGPFELLLCAGDFFGENNDELLLYKSGKRTIPIPTFFLGPSRQNFADNYGIVDDNGEICQNLTYLGQRGTYTVSSGIKIAYLSGHESNKNENSLWEFNKSDVLSLCNSCIGTKSNSGDYKGVDILITPQVPHAIHEKESNTSKLISWLAINIKPRYHFSATNGEYYENLPYRNKADNNTQLELSTRFIALANVGNSTKSKYIYALNVTPIEKMRVMDLIQKTTDEIPCPYNEVNFNELISGSNHRGDGQQYFYDMNSYDGNKRSKRRNQNGSQFEGKKHRPTFDLDQCWFCLSSPNVEKHLVISVGENFYIALAKGPLNESHVLILSIAHLQNLAVLPDDYWAELNKYKTALRQYFSDHNKVVSFFERNYKSSHMQINVVGIDKETEWQLKPTIEDKAEEYKLEFEELLEVNSSLDIPQKCPYFLIELPDGVTRITRDMKNFPLHFGREIYCSENILNCENKIDWKECNLSKTDEEATVAKFRQSFKPYDITD